MVLLAEEFTDSGGKILEVEDKFQHRCNVLGFSYFWDPAMHAQGVGTIRQGIRASDSEHSSMNI